MSSRESKNGPESQKQAQGSAPKSSKQAQGSASKSQTFRPEPKPSSRDLSDEVTEDAVEGKTNSDEFEYPIFMVYSSWSIADLDKFIRSFGDEDDIFGPIRVDRYKGKETDRTVCIFSENVYRNMLDHGYGKRRKNEDFAIERYVLRPHSYPKPNETNDLFVQLTKSLSTSDCREQLSAKLNALIDLGVISVNDFRVKIPLKSRETNDHLGSAFIIFENDVKPDAIAFTRVIIHDSHWNIGESGWELVSCFYSKDRNHLKESRSTGDNRGTHPSQNGTKPMPSKLHMKLATNMPGISVGSGEFHNRFEVLNTENTSDDDSSSGNNNTATKKKVEAPVSTPRKLNSKKPDSKRSTQPIPRVQMTKAQLRKAQAKQNAKKPQSKAKADVVRSAVQKDANAETSSKLVFICNSTPDENTTLSTESVDDDKSSSEVVVDN